jgi:hypothetical protein
MAHALPPRPRLPLLHRFDKLQYANPNAEQLLFAPRSAIGGILTLAAPLLLAAYTAYLVVINEQRPAAMLASDLRARDTRGVTIAVRPSTAVFDVDLPSTGFLLAYEYVDWNPISPCVQHGLDLGWSSALTGPPFNAVTGPNFDVPACPVSSSPQSWMHGSTTHANAPSGFAIDLQFPLQAFRTTCNLAPTNSLGPSTAAFTLQFKGGSRVEVPLGMLQGLCGHVFGTQMLPLVTLELALTQITDVAGQTTGSVAVQHVVSTAIFNMNDAVGANHFPGQPRQTAAAQPSCSARRTPFVM